MYITFSHFKACFVLVLNIRFKLTLQEGCSTRICQTQPAHQHEGFDEVEPILCCG